LSAFSLLSPSLTRLTSQIGELACSQFVDDLPELYVGTDGFTNPRLIIGAHMQGFSAAIQIHRQELSGMTGIEVARTGTVRTATTTNPVHNRATHQRHESQGSHLLMELSASDLDLFVF
jgi:hypothetical protein